MTLRQRWKQTSLPNKLLIETGALVAFGTLFYAGATAVQVCLMRQAATDSAAQVERLSKATDEAIKKAVEASSESLKKSLLDNKDSLDAAIAQNEMALRVNVQQSKKALDASIEASHYDQRAWIGAEVIEAHPSTISVGDSAYVTFAFKNSGKTPARNVRATITKDPVQRGRPPRFTYTGERVARYGLLPPNGSAHVTLSIANSLSTGELRPITSQVLDVLVNGDTIYYIHGFVLYGDIFGNDHWVTICYFARNLPGPIVFGACGEHNDAGDGSDPVYVPLAGIEWPPRD